MAKGKDDKKYTPAQLMALQSSVRTDLARATVGKPTVDPSQGRAPKYENNQRAFDALNTIGRVTTETAALGLGGGALIRGATRLAAKGLGGYVGRISTESALAQNMKGLTNASGMGGRISRTQTPFGPTLRSTKVGSPAEQSARINNLIIGAEKKAVGTGGGAGTKAMIDVLKAGNKTKQVGANLGVIGITGKNRRSK